MPQAAPHPCAKLGCRAVVPRGTRYCDQHEPIERRKRNAEIDERRGSPSARGYDWTWATRIRPAALAREPLCRMCQAEGRITAASQVDHIDGNSRNNDPDNLRSLCTSHHSSRTARDQGFARGRDAS